MYRNWVKISLILVYLVIVAGAIVRMTGSGMGCPDWPKCFGYYIPPTERGELEFQPNRDYEEGQVIIVNETLKVASQDFTSSEDYSEENWSNYEKHDYAIFNPLHTWVEYANRLIGALAGLAVLIMAMLSIKKFRYRKRITLLSFLCVLLMGFQGWLGATVVYSVLAPVKITIHMVMALVIVAVLLYLLYIASEKKKDHHKNTIFQNVLIFSAILTMVQIIMGTQVRQFVDEQIRAMGYGMEAAWMNDPNITFYVHRSFSVLILLINVFLWWQNRKVQLGFFKINWVIGFIIFEILTGIAMYNFDFPVLSQPLHLIIASLLFGIQFYLLLESFYADRKIKNL